MTLCCNSRCSWQFHIELQASSALSQDSCIDNKPRLAQLGVRRKPCPCCAITAVLQKSSDQHSIDTAV